MRRSFSWLFIVLGFTVLTGCEMAAGYLATDFSLAAEPEELAVEQGAEGGVILRLSRILPVDVSPFPVTVTLHEAPTGVTLSEGDAVQIPSGVDEETVTVQVAEDVEPGTYRLVFRGTNGLRTKDAELQLTVTASE